MAQTSRKAKRHKNEKRTADKHLHKNSIKISLLEWTIKIALTRSQHLRKCERGGRKKIADVAMLS